MVSNMQTGGGSTSGTGNTGTGGSTRPSGASNARIEGGIYIVPAHLLPSFPPLPVNPLSLPPSHTHVSTLRYM